MAEANPFNGLPETAHEAIERLFSRLYIVGDWDEEDENLLGLWRDARGDAAKDDWSWWVGYVDDESYGEDAASRDQAIEIGRTRYGEDGEFQIIEARLWADSVKEAAEVGEFAETRNHEIMEDTHA